MDKILITDNDKARDLAEQFAPRRIVSREHARLMANPDSVKDVWLDGDDVELFDIFPNAESMRYAQNGLDFSATIAKIRSDARAMLEYTKPVPEPQPHRPEDDFYTGATLPTSSRPPEFDDDEYQELPLTEQIKTLEPILQNRKIGAGTIAELSAQLIEVCKNNKLFLRDVCTGLFQTVFAKAPLISPARAQTIFTTHFIDRLVIRTKKYKTDETGADIERTSYKSIKKDELNLLWDNVSTHCIFNSRIAFYKSIPEWDGTPRIATFMKQYFNCDANPHFFLLLITCIIGKIHNPVKNYTPFFFDVVSPSRGIGKTLLWSKLVGAKYVGNVKMSKNRGMSDFFVDLYDGNSIIALDDECKWCGSEAGRLNHDEFKDLVSQEYDRFSRKYGQPEVHERSFIIARTSNYVNQVFEPTERRQIIFKCLMPERECRIKNLPDDFWQQLLAEGKNYYEQHGIYELTDDDWSDVMAANLDNFNYETPDNFVIMDYINAVRDAPGVWGVVPSAKKMQGRLWGNYKKYVEFCSEKKKTPVKGRNFWRNLEAMGEVPEMAIDVISDAKYPLQDGGKSRIFAINPLPAAQDDPQDEIPDIPY